VGSLAESLSLNLATVSGLVADLERVHFVERSPDPADRRRTIVRICAGHEALVDAWLDGATAPLLRTLEQLSPAERAAFVKALTCLDAELDSARRSAS
jgi:DNA-binding MarR family transcriptional regulator